MLEKIEAAYLAAMRVIVLIAATLALIVAVVGAVAAAPLLSKQFGLQSEPKQTPISLTTFVQQQAAAPTEETQSDDAQATPMAPGEVVRAAKLIATYAQTKLKSDLDVAGIQQALMAIREDIEVVNRTEYDASLVQLFEELVHSKGKPLSLNRVNQLLQWHKGEFQAAIAAREAEAAASSARGALALAVTGAAIVAFVVILFFFLFVKIERNLRLVRTRETAA